MQIPIRNLAFLLFIGLPCLAFNQVTVWDNGGDKIHWSDPDNWDTNTVPQMGDKVVIDNFEVELDMATQIVQLVVTNQAVIHIQQGLTIKGDSVGIIVSDSELNNDAMISIGVDTTGILLTKDAVVMNNGNITFELCPNGLVIEHGSLFVNSDELVIEDGSNHGIINQGYLENDGIVDVSNIMDDAIVNEHIFVNKNNALVRIMGVGSGGSGFYSDTLSQIVNHGTLEIEDTRQPGLASFGFLDNYGTISMSGNLTYMSSSSSPFSDTKSKIVNHPNGIIVQMDGSSGMTIGSNDSLFNYGLLSVKDIYGNGILSDGYVENHDSILVDSSMTGGAVFNRGDFINKATGIVQCVKCKRCVYNDSTFINAGEISGSTLRIGIHNSYFFEVKASGQIDFSDIDRWSLKNHADFNLYGLYESNNHSDIGILNTGNIFIANSGSMVIKTIVGDALDHSAQFGGTLLVEGILDLDP